MKDLFSPNTISTTTLNKEVEVNTLDNASQIQNNNLLQQQQQSSSSISSLAWLTNSNSNNFNRSGILLNSLKEQKEEEDEDEDSNWIEHDLYSFPSHSSHSHSYSNSNKTPPITPIQISFSSPQSQSQISSSSSSSQSKNQIQTRSSKNFNNNNNNSSIFDKIVGGGSPTRINNNYSEPLREEGIQMNYNNNNIESNKKIFIINNNNTNTKFNTNSLPTTPINKSYSDYNTNKQGDTRNNKEIPWTWPTRGSKDRNNINHVNVVDDDGWSNQNLPFTSFPPPTTTSNQQHYLNKNQFESPTKKSTTLNSNRIQIGDKMLIEEEEEEVSSTWGINIGENVIKEEGGEERGKEKEVISRYVRVHNVPRDSTELDLTELFIKPFSSHLKSCFTSLLRTHGIIILIFFDPRQALNSIQYLSNISLTSSTSSSSRGNYNTLLKGFLITRESLFLLNASNSNNQILSPSEGTFILSLLPFPHMINNSFTPFIPTLSPHSNFLTQFGNLRSIKLITPTPNNNGISGSRKESWLIKFWDERNSEECFNCFKGVEWNEKGFMVPVGTGEGVARFEISLEPDLFNQSVDHVTQQSNSPTQSNSYTLPPIAQVRLPQSSLQLKRSPPQLRTPQEIHSSYYNSSLSIQMMENQNHDQQVSGKLSPPHHNYHQESFRQPLSSINSNTFVDSSSSPSSTSPYYKNEFVHKIGYSSAVGGGGGIGIKRGNKFQDNNNLQNSWSNSAANPINSTSINSIPSIPSTPSWGIYRDEKIPARNVLQLDRIERGLDVRTTLMLKNIPNRMTDTALMEYIDEAVGRRAYDFFYLRIDFSTECTVGYGFVNFINIDGLLKFAKARLGTRWNLYSSDKICVASYANIQGKENLVARFKNSSIMEEVAAYRPKIFYSDGPLIGQPEPFPPSDDPHRKARSASNTSSNGLFPAYKPIFKVTHALKGLHM